MPDSNKIIKDDLIQPSLFSRLCEAGKYFPHVHPNETIIVATPCAGRGRLNIVTCQDNGRESDIADVGGLDILNVKLHTAGKKLPEFIPIVPHEMFKRPSHEIPSKTVGVVLNDILTTKVSSKYGRLRLLPGSKLNEAVLNNRAFQGKRVILFSTGPDVLIETLWWRRNEKDIFRAMQGKKSICHPISWNSDEPCWHLQTPTKRPLGGVKK